MAVELRMQRQAKRFQGMKLLRSDGKFRSGVIYLNVTAFVDMMTVLVIFLVMQFNSSGEMLFVSKDLVMPGVENGKNVTRVPIVSLSRTGTLYFEGSAIVENLGSQIDEQNWKIAKLEERLIDNRKRYEALGSARLDKIALSEDPTSTVNVQIDRDVKYELVKRLLYTCEISGYGRIRFVMGDEHRSTVNDQEIQLES